MEIIDGDTVYCTVLILRAKKLQIIIRITIVSKEKEEEKKKKKKRATIRGGNEQTERHHGPALAHRRRMRISLACVFLSIVLSILDLSLDLLYHVLLSKSSSI